jgi:NADH-quinone oxidoreductase subunit A
MRGRTGWKCVGEVQYSFFVIALIFLIFDVEVVFLFPWALVFRQLGLFAFIEMAVFLVILIVGFTYVWAKGDLDWDKPRPEVPSVLHTPRMDRPPIPKEIEGIPA